MPLSLLSCAMNIQGDTSDCGEPPVDFRTKVPFGLACPGAGEARPKRNFCFDVNGKFESTRFVTLYLHCLQKQRLITCLTRGEALHSS